MNNAQSYLEGLRDGVPIGLGYLAVSFSFGIMAAGSMLTPFEASLISFTNLTSAGQFAGLEIIAAGGTLLEMALTQLIINLRYCLMSFSLSQKLDRSFPWFHRIFVAMGITDEIFGVSAAREGALSPWYVYGLMSMAIPGWTLGTFLGAVSGNLLPDFIVSALSVAIYGMFLAVIIPPAKRQKPVLFVVLGSMGLSCLFEWLPVLSRVSSGFAIILITLFMAGLAAWLFPVPAKEEKEGA